MLNFKDVEGNPVRDFDSVDQMDEYMIDNWNSTVRPEDIVYHLGDIAMKNPGIRTLEKLNGKKYLIMGNHDIAKAKFYLKFFRNVMSYKVFPKHLIIMSHIPLHPGGLIAYRAQKWKINIHGHTHTNNVTIEGGMEDPRYINMSVEKWNYTPTLLDELIDLAEKRREHATELFPIEVGLPVSSSSPIN
jgi:calcineurin-like phosphoesterase family protein